MTLVSLLAVPVFLAPVAHATPDASGVDTSAPMLLLGNSYTQGGSLDRVVLELARSTMGDDPLAGSRRLAAGGLRLPDHLRRVMGDDAAWVEAFETPGAWSTVVLQDQSQIPGLPTSDPYWQESAEAAVALDQRIAALGAETMLFITWGRRDGDSSLPELYPDFPTMNARLEEGYEGYAALALTEGRTIRFAPVGRAFAHVYDRADDPSDPSSAFHRLYAGDGSHPSELGSSLAAGVIFAAATGWEPQWEGSPPGGTAEDGEWMAAAIRAAVSPVDAYPDSWAGPAADHSSPLDVELPAETAVISGARRCQTLTDFGAHSFDGQSLRVGARHAAGAGCGRLWIDEGTLAIGELELGVQGRQGHLSIHGGRTTAERVQVGGDGWGRVRVTGGSAALGALVVTQGEVLLEDGELALGAGEGLLTQSGGVLSLDAGSLQGSLDQLGGALHLSDPLGPGPVRFAGAVQLDGSLVVESLAAGDDRVLLEAESVVLGDELVLILPDGWGWELDGNQLLAVQGGGETGGEDGGGDGSSGDPDEENPSDTPATSGTVTVAKDAPDEGCAATGAAGLCLVGLGSLWGLGRRRRSAHR